MVETPTLPQVVSNSLVVYNNFSILYVLRVSTIISDLNFEANYVRAQRKKFTKMCMKAFVLLEVVFYVFIYIYIYIYIYIHVQKLVEMW